MKDILLGFTQASPFTAPRPVVLEERERLRTHMLAVGSPGSGKSKFLEWLIRSDIENGTGLCVIDIHGSLYDAVKKWCSYRYALDNVVLLDPSKGEYVKGFNPFRPREGVAIDVQASGMVQALLRPWGAEDTNQTPTLDVMSRLIFMAMMIRSIPLHEVMYLIDFEQKKIREDVIASFSEPVIRSAWSQVHQLTKSGEWRAEVLSTRNRFFRLVQSEAVRRFMGVLDPTFNIDVLDIMNKGKVLLVNLKESTHLTEENAKAIAALLLNDLFKSAIMFRDRDTLGHEPRPFYTYVDEWQNIVTPDVGKILAQARKFGLLLVLANQDLSQIEKAFSPPFVGTLLTCCRAKVCFGGLNRDDAARMTREMLAGQLDLNETKYELASTKFRPTYQRDKVYGQSQFHSDSETISESETEAISDSMSCSLSWTTTSGWVRSAEGSRRAGISKSYTRARTVGRAVGSSSGDGVSVADIPILIPEEFTETSSRTTYTLEEQIWRYSDRFMEQHQRHCYSKLPGQPTVPMLVPVVENYFVAPEVVVEYEKDIAALTGAQRANEVDDILEAQPSLLESPRKQLTAASDEDNDDEFFRE